MEEDLSTRVKMTQLYGMDALQQGRRSSFLDPGRAPGHSADLTPHDCICCSPPGSSVHGILQARILERVAMPSSKRSSPPRDRTHICFVSSLGGWVLYTALSVKPSLNQKLCNREKKGKMLTPFPSAEQKVFRHLHQ